ncbi:MAG: glutamate 5-kinase [Planctomycetaceae bacterium]
MFRDLPGNTLSLSPVVVLLKAGRRWRGQVAYGESNRTLVSDVQKARSRGVGAVQHPLSITRSLTPRIMTMDTRQDVVARSRTVVVKVGSNVLSRADDTLDPERIGQFAEQISRIRAGGRRVVVVSSGAVAAGIGRLRLPGRPTDLPHLQAAAAAGQAHLIRVWDEAFNRHNFHAAQILVTANDFKHRGRYLNVRNTIHTLFELGAVPVVNENDTVSIDEIKFGDNDKLAAMVSNLVDAPLLVILSIVDGLYDGDPTHLDSHRISIVPEWRESLLKLALNIKSSRGTGGMQSKLDAVRIASAVGAPVVVAGGTLPRVLDRLLEGEDLGTLFLPSAEVVPAWKRWIGFTIAPKGRLRLDAGATRAVREGGRSLLAIGVTKIEGSFQDGELVSLIDPDGLEFARGLVNYDAATLREIIGKRNEEIETILGHLPYGSVVHRDNLAITV